MVTYEQNPVSRAIWQWPAPVIAKQFDPASNRRKALIQAVVMGVIASILAFGFDAAVMPLVICSIAAVLLVAAVLAPAVYRAIDDFLVHVLGRGIGLALTWLLLVPFYYAVFAPGRMLLRLRGLDPMKRRFPTDESTYWQDHRESRVREKYRKQF